MASGYARRNAEPTMPEPPVISNPLLFIVIQDIAQVFYLL